MASRWNGLYFPVPQDKNNQAAVWRGTAEAFASQFPDFQQSSGLWIAKLQVQRKPGALTFPAPTLHPPRSSVNECPEHRGALAFLPGATQRTPGGNKEQTGYISNPRFNYFSQLGDVSKARCVLFWGRGDDWEGILRAHWLAARRCSWAPAAGRALLIRRVNVERATHRGPGVSQKRGWSLPGRKWCLLAARRGDSSVDERGQNARQFVATVI